MRKLVSEVCAYWSDQFAQTTFRGLSLLQANLLAILVNLCPYMLDSFLGEHCAGAFLGVTQQVSIETEDIDVALPLFLH